MKFKRIWVIYFFIKLFYMFFAIYIFSHLTKLGDTFDYLNWPLQFTPRIIYSSTALMRFLGALFKLIFRADVLACIPFMLLSFYGIYYAVDRLNLYKYAAYILILFSLPNFGVWTSVLGKEAVGCFFSAVIAVMLIKKLNGPYKLKLIDYVALYLCAIFKTQYLLFILQALMFLTITHKFRDKKHFPLILGLILISLNIVALYAFRDLIDELARGLIIHFKSPDPNLAQSTRSEAPWLVHYGFFHSAAYGMFISFFGPTFSEMSHKPTQFLAGIESMIMIFCFLLLLWPRLKYNLSSFRFNPTIFITYFIVFIGILFVHYPFGFLNPGSAIRYRCNFYALFVLLLLYLLDRADYAKIRDNAILKV
ncbi:MAG: hypothetical protein JWR67_2178 [Mucilaginibacter sp.]|nr:hypothetical protein [Mucilaginibacter sp.]